MIGRLPDLSSGGASGRPSGVSGRDLSANVGETTVEIGRRWFEQGDTWTAIGDQTLVSVHPITLTSASGRPDFSIDREPTALFRGRLLFKPHGRLILTLLAIFIDIAT